MNKLKLKNLVKLFICVILGISVTKIFDNMFILLLAALGAGFILEKI